VHISKQVTQMEFTKFELIIDFNEGSFWKQSFRKDIIEFGNVTDEKDDQCRKQTFIYWHNRIGYCNRMIKIFIRKNKKHQLIKLNLELLPIYWRAMVSKSSKWMKFVIDDKDEHASKAMTFKNLKWIEFEIVMDNKNELLIKQLVPFYVAEFEIMIDNNVVSW
jgi:hypothetical protein